jgi:hypothetical protein
VSEFIEREPNSRGSISGQKPVQNPNEKKKSRTAQVPSQNNICFVKKELKNSNEQLRFLGKRLKCIIL